MIYTVRHLTTYSYANEVAYARCHLKLTPLSDAGQTLLNSRIHVRPFPLSRATAVDPFGATAIALTIATPHDELIIDSRCLVDVHAAPIPTLEATPAWEAVREAALRVQRLDPASPALYLYPTPSTPLVSQITTFARECFTPDRPVLAAGAALMARFRREFTYDPEATDVRTPPPVAFAARRGVCQDFAHVMICGLRGLGLPARYVSGYLRTIPAPGQKRLEGADATHAWVELWCGNEHGWIGLDPTNNLLVQDDHLRLATGRDYRDVAPIEGVLLGAGGQTIDVKVDVIAQDEPAAQLVRS